MAKLLNYPSFKSRLFLVGILFLTFNFEPREALGQIDPAQITNSALLIKHNLSATSAPTVNDDSAAGYAVGSFWMDTVAQKLWQANSVDVGAAVWLDRTAGGGGGGDVTGVSGTSEEIEVNNSGGPVPVIGLPATIAIPGKTLQVGRIELVGDISPSQITADQNNYNPTGLSTASTLRLTSDASRNVTGLAGGSDGRLLTVHNVGVQPITFVDESVSSTAANRFALSGNVTVSGDQSITLQYDSTSSRWRVVSSGSSAVEADTLDTVFDRGKVIDGATSFANAFRVTDSSNDGVAIYRSAGTGPVITCVISGVENDCDKITKLNASKKWEVQDDAGGAIVSISEAGVTTYGTSYKPKKSVYFPAGALSTDGTQCAAPAEVTINSGAKRWTIICADNDASTIYGEVEMPDAWDGGTVTAMGSFVQTAADTNAMNSDIAFACRANGDTINNTWGTEVAMDIANMGGSSKIDTVTTAAATPNGTCTGNGTLLQFRWQLDATGTTTAVATLHMLGFKIEYTVSSLSD